MDSWARFKAYAKQAGQDPFGNRYRMTVKQEKRYVKKWWRDATPAEQDRYKHDLEKWEARLVANGGAQRLKSGRRG